MKTFRDIFETVANVSGDLAVSKKTSTPGSFDKMSGPDGPTRKRRKELDLYNGKVFTVSKEQFEKFKEAGTKIRGTRWRSYMEEDNELAKEIKSYSMRNPSSPVVVKNGETGETMFVRRRWSDSRLRHNRK